MNIYLIGYRCTGKTIVGRLLARRMSWDFVDTDDVVETQSGQGIDEIVAQSGWQTFRDRERRVVRAVSAASRQVVSTGGGVPCDAGSRRFMKESGLVVWLRAEPDIIGKRLGADVHSAHLRPALSGKNPMTEIRQILAQREPIYREAMHFDVATDTLSPQQVAAAVLRKLEKFGQLA